MARTHGLLEAGLLAAVIDKKEKDVFWVNFHFSSAYTEHLN